MELEFTFRNLESTEALKSWAQKRFKKVEKHLRDPQAAHVTLSVDKHRHRADIIVHDGGVPIRASDESDNMYSTLDSVMSKVEAYAQRLKEREVSQRHAAPQRRGGGWEL